MSFKLLLCLTALFLLLGAALPEAVPADDGLVLTDGSTEDDSQDNYDESWADLQLELAYGGPLMARKSNVPPDPSFWWLDDKELRETMESDEELKRLYIEAWQKRRWRKRTGNIFLGCGSACIAIGAGVGFSSKALNIPDDMAQATMVGGAVLGIGLLTPGIILKARKSNAEKEYIEYVRDKYDITPPNIRRYKPVDEPLIRIGLIQIPLP